MRYADDFLLGFVGPKSEAEAIRDRLSEFLNEKLKLQLSIEKTLITHAVNEKAKFLGYEVTVTRANALVTENGKRNANGCIVLLMPRKVVQDIFGRFSRNGKVTHRPEMARDHDLTIINRYQAVLRGIYNYYCLATNVSRRMAYIRYILEASLTKTLASKHRISVTSVYRKYSYLNPVSGLKALRAIKEREGKEPLISVFGGLPFHRKTGGVWEENPDFRFENAWFAAGGDRSEIIQRMLADKCEICGADGPVAMHHVRKLADLDKPGRTPKATWMKIMSARKRKSLAVCQRCHDDIHSGRHDGPSPAKLTGEPDAVKVASPVRRGAIGKGAE